MLRVSGLQKNSVQGNYVTYNRLNVWMFAPHVTFPLFQVQFREACLSVATQLLMAHTPSVVLTQTKALLATLHPTKQAYYVHKVSG